jgi:hypothetical protein
MEQLWNGVTTGENDRVGCQKMGPLEKWVGLEGPLRKAGVWGSG